MVRMNSERTGFALAATVMALVLVGVLVTGGFMAAMQEGRVPATGHYASEAFNLAEHGLHRIVGGWSLSDFEAISTGTSASLTDTVRINGQPVGRAVIEVRRLAHRLYFIHSTGEMLHGATGARRSLGMIARTKDFDVVADRAVQVYGKLTVGGGARVIGSDSIPQGWDEADCPPSSDRSGVVASDLTLVAEIGNGSVHGEPKWAEDAELDPTDFTRFGDWRFEELAALASKVVPAGAMLDDTSPTVNPDGSCNTNDDENWGAPANSDHVCHRYFPIIHAEGDLHLDSGAASGAQGQGILLVEGDLKISGAYEFYGIVVVKGRLEMGPGNARVHGTATILNNGADSSMFGELAAESTVTGNAIMGLSRCAVHRAVRYNPDISRAFPVTERSWIDLTAAGVEG